jgi:hypothetical protein
MTVSNVEITGNTFTDCEGRGIQIAREGVTDVLASDNTIERCGRGGISVLGGMRVNLKGNRVSRSRPAISVLAGAREVVIERNGCGGGGIELQKGASSRQSGNEC